MFTKMHFVNEELNIRVLLDCSSSLEAYLIRIATNEQVKVLPPSVFLLFVMPQLNSSQTNYIFVIYVKIQTKPYIIRLGWVKYEKWKKKPNFSMSRGWRRLMNWFITSFNRFLCHSINFHLNNWFPPWRIDSWH